MRNLTENESMLLEELQKDFPLHRRPFLEIGKRIGLQELETLRIAESLRSEGLIREISALLDGGRLGFKSTLAAVSAGADRLERIAECINSHEGVSHNYLRDHSFNLWFTLTIPENADFASELGRMLGDEKIAGLLILPSIRTFKLNVHLPFQSDADVDCAQRSPGSNAAAIAQDIRKAGGAVVLNSLERRVLALIEEELPLSTEPWDELSAVLDVPVREVINTVRSLKEKGVIRRIAAVLRHRQAGFGSNGMACFRLPEDEVVRAGVEAASFLRVSHCYQRQTHPRWPYSLYTMVHARTKSECSGIVQEIAQRIGCGDYLVLYSLVEYKKQRIKYFNDKCGIAASENRSERKIEGTF